MVGESGSVLVERKNRAWKTWATDFLTRVKVLAGHYTNDQVSLDLENLSDSVTLSQLLGIDRALVSQQGSSAANLAKALHCVRASAAPRIIPMLSVLSQQLKACTGDPDMYTEGLKLLQDLCSSSGELPSSIWLDQVDVDREELIGKGGEAHIYAGVFAGQKVVVRDVVMPQRFWKSPAGQDTMKVIALIYLPRCPDPLLNYWISSFAGKR